MLDWCQDIIRGEAGLAKAYKFAAGDYDYSQNLAFKAGLSPD